MRVASSPPPSPSGGSQDWAALRCRRGAWAPLSSTSLVASQQLACTPSHPVASRRSPRAQTPRRPANTQLGATTATKGAAPTSTQHPRRTYPTKCLISARSKRPTGNRFRPVTALNLCRFRSPSSLAAEIIETTPGTWFTSQIARHTRGDRPLQRRDWRFDRTSGTARGS